MNTPQESILGSFIFNAFINNFRSPFYKITVPTVDTVRYDFLVRGLLKSGAAVLMTGPVGTGKTSVAQSALFSLDQAKYALLHINMSAQTSSNNLQVFFLPNCLIFLLEFVLNVALQDSIESRVEKRTKGHFAPPRGKKLVAFLDDMNMPAKETYGSQPPLELLRQWMDYTFWYDRLKQTKKYIEVFTQYTLFLNLMRSSHSRIC